MVLVGTIHLFGYEYIGWLVSSWLQVSMNTSEELRPALTRAPCVMLIIETLERVATRFPQAPRLSLPVGKSLSKRISYVASRSSADSSSDLEFHGVISGRTKQRIGGESYRERCIRDDSLVNADHRSFQADRDGNVWPDVDNPIVQAEECFRVGGEESKM